MKKHKMTSLSITVLLILIMSAGCNLPNSGQDLTVDERVGTAQQQTLNAGGSDSGSGDQNGNESTVTETLQPLMTLTPTLTLTPTQEKPMVSVSVDTNCRTGPGKVYDWIGGLLVGEQAEVVGQSMDGQYWVIKNPDKAGECWLWGQYASVTGPTTSLAKYTPPPTPTPVFSWEGNWTIYLGPQNGPYMDLAMSVTVNGNTFTGYIDSPQGPINMTGTISNDFLSVSGNWTSTTQNGFFNFYAVGSNQFNGNYGDQNIPLAWCGSLGGGQPSPCFHP